MVLPSLLPGPAAIGGESPAGAREATWKPAEGSAGDEAAVGFLAFPALLAATLGARRSVGEPDVEADGAGPRHAPAPSAPEAAWPVVASPVPASADPRADAAGAAGSGAGRPARPARWSAAASPVPASAALQAIVARASGSGSGGAERPAGWSLAASPVPASAALQAAVTGASGSGSGGSSSLEAWRCVLEGGAGESADCRRTPPPEVARPAKEGTSGQGTEGPKAVKAPAPDDAPSARQATPGARTPAVPAGTPRPASSIAAVAAADGAGRPGEATESSPVISLAGSRESEVAGLGSRSDESGQATTCATGAAAARSAPERARQTQPAGPEPAARDAASQTPAHGAQLGTTEIPAATRMAAGAVQHGQSGAGSAVASPGAPPPAVPQSIRAQVATRILAGDVEPGGRQRLTIQLEPAHLGRVEVTIQRNGDQLTVTFTAERPEAEAALREGAGDLAETLLGQRQRWTEVEIRTGRQDGDGQGRQDARRDRDGDHEDEARHRQHRGRRDGRARG